VLGQKGNIFHVFLGALVSWCSNSHFGIIY